MLVRAGILLTVIQFITAFGDKLQLRNREAAPHDDSFVLGKDTISTCAGNACQDCSDAVKNCAAVGCVLLQRNRSTLRRVPTSHSTEGLLHTDYNTSMLQSEASHANAMLQSPAGNPDAGQAEERFSLVSVTMLCVMFLTLLLLLCYTSSAILRNSSDFSEKPKLPLITEGLEVAIRCASHGAALGTLFVGHRMFVLARTGGDGNPYAWVKGCMVCATVGLTLQIIVSLALSYAMVEPKEGDPSISELAGHETDAHPRLDPKHFKSKDYYYLAVALQAVAIVAIYGGAGGVIVGTFLYDSPSEASASGVSNLIQLGLFKTLDVSPAVICVILLNLLFFVSQLYLFIHREKGGEMGGVIVASLRAGKAPMLAVLFLAARMRNLQVDPPHGLAPLYMKVSFYTVVGALFCEMAASIVGGPPQDVHEGTTLPIKDINNPYHPRATHPGVLMVQQFFAFVLFGALVNILYYITLTGPEFPLSVTMRCVMVMSGLFFIVHVFQWLASFSSRMDKWGDILRETALGAGVAVSLCPMLSILLVGCRMRALQLTNQQGAPQWWAQDAMTMLVFAIVLQVVCCLALPVFTGMATTVDGDGNSKYEMKPMIGAYTVQIIKYIALLALYGGVLIVCAAIFMMSKGMQDDHYVKPEDMWKKVMADVGFVLLIFFAATFLSSAKVIGLVIKWAIESVDETFLGVQITVGKAALSLFYGYVFIGNLVVENPEDHGFESPCLLKIDRLVIDIDVWRAITSGAREIEINTLVLNGVEVNYEWGMFKKSNVQTIIDFLNPPPEKQDKKSCTDICTPKKQEVKQQELPAPEKKDKKSKKVPQPSNPNPPSDIILGLLEVKNIGANVWNSNAGKMLSVYLGNIETDNFQEHFGGKTRVLVGDIIGMVLKTILFTVLANAKNVANHVANLGKSVGRGCSNCLPCVPCLPCQEVAAKQAQSSMKSRA